MKFQWLGYSRNSLNNKYLKEINMKNLLLTLLVALMPLSLFTASFALGQEVSTDTYTLADNVTNDPATYFSATFLKSF
jgi:hypothetical protein